VGMLVSFCVFLCFTDDVTMYVGGQLGSADHKEERGIH